MPARRPLVYAVPGLLLAVAVLPLTVATVGLGMVMTGAFTVTWLTLALWSAWTRDLLPVGIVLLLPAGAAPFWTAPLTEASAAWERLDGDRKARGDVSLPGAVGLYTAHGLGCLGLYALGLPEPASTLTGLHWPGPALRTVDDDAPLRDPRVRAAARILVDAVRTGTAPPPIPLTWDDREPRAPAIALAADGPARLSAQAAGDAVEITLTVRVDPARRRAVDLGRLDGTRLYFDPNVLDVLSRRGWIWPYDRAWTFRVRADDPRLRDPNPAVPTVGEARLLSLGELLAG